MNVGAAVPALPMEGRAVKSGETRPLQSADGTDPTVGEWGLHRPLTSCVTGGGSGTIKAITTAVSEGLFGILRTRRINMRINPITTIWRRATLAACLSWCVCSLCLCSAPALASGGVLFVDDDAAVAGDGLSWDTAYRFLQEALAFASDPANGVGEIRVAQGMYQPDRSEGNPKGTGDRDRSFELLGNVDLIGGYAGLGGRDPDDRDVDLYVTVLSGDLNGDDQVDFVNYGENSRNVVLVTDIALDEATALDSFVVTSGNADDMQDPGWRGGGLHHDGDHGSVLTITDCTFVACMARFGAGGVELGVGVVNVTNCGFLDNHVFDGGGGGLRTSFTILTINDCLFDRNEASDRGGAVNLTNFLGDINILDTVFTENVAGFSGGAVYLSGSERVVMRGCEVLNNVAVGVIEGEGGGLYADDADVDLVDCVFIDNEAERFGGGAYLKADGSAVNCEFVGNQTLLKDGGAVEMRGGKEYSFVNCLFVGNVAAGNGGGISDPTSGGGPGRQFLNSTFVANSAGGVGGGVWAVEEDTIMSNCILWGNTDAGGGGQDGQIAFRETPFPINYCCIEGWDGTLLGIGNHGNDPLFVDIDGEDDVIGTEDDNLRLTSGSPCVDAADNDAVPNDDADADDDGFTDELLPIDLDGNPRFVDDPATKDTGNGRPPIVDMGAYEFQGVPCIWDLDGDNVVGTGDLILLLGSWGDPYGTADLIELLGNWGPCP